LLAFNLGEMYHYPLNTGIILYSEGQGLSDCSVDLRILGEKTKAYRLKIQGAVNC